MNLIPVKKDFHPNEKKCWTQKFYAIQASRDLFIHQESGKKMFSAHDLGCF